jgi:hypothetical protein
MLSLRVQVLVGDARRCEKSFPNVHALYGYLTKHAKLGHQHAEHFCKHSGISAVYSKGDI